MSIMKSISAFLVTFVLSFYCFTLKAETKRLEIVELDEGVRAHKYVQNYMKEHSISIKDVIDAYKAAMSKREEGSRKTIFEERESFVIYIAPEDKMIFSIGPNGPINEKGEE